MIAQNLSTNKKPDSESVFRWHSRLNTYVMENNDVLLVSASQQWLLPATQFPFMADIDGVTRSDKIIETNDIRDAQKTALFYFHINQLVESNLLVDAESFDIFERYQRPIFDDVNRIGSSAICYRYFNDSCECVNLSALSLRAVTAFETFLEDVLDRVHQEMVANVKKSYSFNESFSLIVVDDFLDPRIADVCINENFLVMTISGEKVWVSPLFKRDEMPLFCRQQQLILDNQPVRKMLLNRWPERAHSYAFVADQVFTSRQSQEIGELLFAQLQSSDDRQLAIYTRQSHVTEYHAINPYLDVAHDFAQQVSEPVQLSTCIGVFEKDGGSRSISAEDTVKKLMPLVSPVTGIISHLQEVEAQNSDDPINIYRTGFFKTPHQTTKQAFDHNDFVQICMGKGVSHQQSKASALSEAVERYCALYQTDVPLLEYSQSELRDAGKRSVSFQELVPYSAQQYRNFNNPEHADFTRKQSAQPYDGRKIHWLPTWSLSSNESVYLPLSQCFTNIPFDDDQFGRWHSNGCAAGNTLEEAILQGLFELIERDAIAIWWYNRIPRPAFDLSRLDTDNLAALTASLSPPSLENKAPDSAHDFWVLDLTHDLGVPVMAGIGKNKKTGGLVMGFGCHLIPEMAAQRALTELCQLIPIRNQKNAPFDFDAIEEGPYLFPNAEAKPIAPELSSKGDIKADITSIVARLKAHNFETLVLNYSRGHIPLKTAKVFVPGLCHMWPQFGNERLYRALLSMGWLDKPNSEASINLQALYI